MNEKKKIMAMNSIKQISTLTEGGINLINKSKNKIRPRNKANQPEYLVIAS